MLSTGVFFAGARFSMEGPARSRVPAIRRNSRQPARQAPWRSGQKPFDSCETSCRVSEHADHNHFGLWLGKQQELVDESQTLRASDGLDTARCAEFADRRLDLVANRVNAASVLASDCVGRRTKRHLCENSPLGSRQSAVKAFRAAVRRAPPRMLQRNLPGPPRADVRAHRLRCCARATSPVQRFPGRTPRARVSAR